MGTCTAKSNPEGYDISYYLVQQIEALPLAALVKIDSAGISSHYPHQLPWAFGNGKF